MKLKSLKYPIKLILASAVLLTFNPSLLAQIGGQIKRTNDAGIRPNDVYGPAMQASTSATAQSSSRVHWERDFFSNLLRDSNAETTLSKLAIHQSSDEGVKNLARRTISDNLLISKSLYGGSLGNICPVISKTPGRVLEVTKKMKHLQGIQFDGTYLSELEAYVQHDQKVISSAIPSNETADARTMVSRMRILADHRAHQISKVAEDENIGLR